MMAAHKKQVRRDSLSALHADLLMTAEGLKGGGVRIGRSAGVMHNKFSDAVPHSEVTHHEAVALAHYVNEQTGSLAFVEAVCAEFGGIFVPLPEGAAGDDDVLDDYLDIVKHFGDLSKEFMEAREDGVIERSEFEAMRVRGRRSVRAVLHFLVELESMVRELPDQTVVPMGVRRG